MIISNGLSTEGLYRQYDSTLNASNLQNGDNAGSLTDDTAVTLSIRENIRGNIPDLLGNTAGSQSSISYIQATNNSLDNMMEIMGRMNALSAQSLHAGVDASERIKIDTEMDKLKEQLLRIQNEAKKSIENVDEEEKPEETSFDNVESLKLLRNHYGEMEKALVNEITANAEGDTVSPESFTKSLGNILHEAGNALMAQANQSNQGVLSLLF